MGWFANLKIGKKYEFSSRKYTIPYTWCRIFDSFNSWGVSKTTVKHARDRLYSTGLTIDLLEKQISEFTGWDVSEWQRSRDYNLEEEYFGFKEHLKKMY
jgi:hypothetical protein